MTWDYRVIRHGDGTYGIHEVYYDDDGCPEGMTEDPVAPFGECPCELQRELVRMLSATVEPPLDEEVFDEDGDHPWADMWEVAGAIDLERFEKELDLG